MVHCQRVSLTLPHSHLDWIFSPIWVLTFHPTDAFEEHRQDIQMHVHHATCMVDTWFWTRGRGKMTQSFCLACGCESKLPVAHPWATEMNLKRLANERGSAAALFLRSPSWFACPFWLFHFGDDFQLQRIDMFVLVQASSPSGSLM